ncbi:MAG TPA: transglycosylase SLT domain-containing protein, partial [Burkholderiales bacterium]|nr:transglycosylase SLT domain-containing protein [Burkholderiales bacterium]
MEPTRTKKRVLTFSLTFSAALIFGGCASVPDEPASAASADPARKVVTDENPGMSAAKTAGSADTTESTPTSAAMNKESTTSASAQGDRIVDDESAAPARAVEPETLATQSIWARIRAGLRLPPVDAELTAQHEQWFIENAEFREALFDRAKLYLYYIVEEVDKRGMPMEVALLPAIESAYKPYAYSRARASGLWQFIPSTGRLYGLKKNWWYDGRR